YASPTPSLVMVIVNVAAWPAMSGPFPDFTTSRSGHWTTTESVERSSPVADAGSLVADTVAVLGTVPQCAGSGTPDRGTTKVAPGGSVPIVHDRTPAVIEQLVLSSLQVIPPGRVSVRVTPAAVPGPALLTVRVKPIGSPALTGLASASLRTLMSGH